MRNDSRVSCSFQASMVQCHLATSGQKQMLGGKTLFFLFKPWLGTGMKRCYLLCGVFVCHSQGCFGAKCQTAGYSRFALNLMWLKWMDWLLVRLIFISNSYFWSVHAPPPPCFQILFLLSKCNAHLFLFWFVWFVFSERFLMQTDKAK